MGRPRYEYLFRCDLCGYEYRAPLKATYVQCPTPSHYPRLSSKSVEAKFVRKIDRKAEQENA